MYNAINKYQNQKCIIFDESGNLGSSGRYFVIACIETNNYRALHNIMHRKLGIAKAKFPALSVLHTHEIKAKEAYPCVRHHILECIASKELSVSYIVADLNHVKSTLLIEKNIFYNYLMRILLDQLITSADNGKVINIICDNKSTKVGSANSLEEYLKLHFVYDRGYDITLRVEYLDSNASFAYPVQAADYVANALYAKYEYGEDLYYSVISSKVKKPCNFL